MIRWKVTVTRIEVYTIDAWSPAEATRKALAAGHPAYRLESWADAEMEEPCPTTER